MLVGSNVFNRCRTTWLMFANRGFHSFLKNKKATPTFQIKYAPQWQGIKCLQGMKMVTITFKNKLKKTQNKER